MSALPTTAIEPDAAFLPLAVLCRKICSLRARGRTVEASHLQTTELTRTVTDLRVQLGADALPESRIREIFSREQDRVTDASVLAELIVHLLPAAPAPAHAPAATPSPVTVHSPPSPPRSAVVAPSHAPAIADLLDDMLAQDAKPRRGGPRAA